MYKEQETQFIQEIPFCQFGKIVYEDLTQNPTFLSQIQYSEKLTRTDIYIDMLGNGGKLSQEDYTEAPTLILQLGTIIIAFPILHYIGSKIGIFPYFFEPKEKKNKKEKNDENLL